MKLSLIQIQTTSYCNGRCIICPYKGSWFEKNPGIMSDELYTKILNDIVMYDPTFNGRFCPYLSNEPFTDKKIISRIEEAIDILPSPLYIEVSTNLFLPTKSQIDQLLELYEKCKWNGRIMVSHHGTNKVLYEHIMQIPYGKARDNLAYLIKKADKRLPIWIHTACQSRDDNYIVTSPLEIKRQWLRFLSENELPTENIAIYPLMFNSRSGNVQLKGWNYTTEHATLSGCPRINDQLHIIQNGEVILCCNDYHHEVVLGDLTKQTIAEIYNSESYKNIKAIIDGKVPPPDNFICTRCQWVGG